LISIKSGYHSRADKVNFVEPWISLWFSWSTVWCDSQGFTLS